MELLLLHQPSCTLACCLQSALVPLTCLLCDRQTLSRDCWSTSMHNMLNSTLHCCKASGGDYHYEAWCLCPCTCMVSLHFLACPMPCHVKSRNCTVHSVSHCDRRLVHHSSYLPPCAAGRQQKRQFLLRRRGRPAQMSPGVPSVQSSEPLRHAPPYGPLSLLVETKMGAMLMR